MIGKEKNELILEDDRYYVIENLPISFPTSLKIIWLSPHHSIGTNLSHYLYQTGSSNKNQIKIIFLDISNYIYPVYMAAAIGY